MDDPAPLKTYYLLFAAAYVGVTVLVVLLSIVFAFDMHSFISFVITFVAAAVPVHFFCKNLGRVPQGPEKTRLVVGSYLISLVVQAVFLAFLLWGNEEEALAGLKDMADELSPVILGAIIFFSLALSYFAVWASYAINIRNYQRAFDVKKDPQHGK